MAAAEFRLHARLATHVGGAHGTVHEGHERPAARRQSGGRFVQGPLDLRDRLLCDARRRSVREDQPRLNPLGIDLREYLERGHAAADEPDREDQDCRGTGQHGIPVFNRRLERGRIAALHEPLEAVVAAPLHELQGGQERPQRGKHKLEEPQHGTVVVGEMARQYEERLGE